MANNKMTVSDRIACGGVFADVKRILESGNQTYINCLRKSLAAYIAGIEIGEGGKDFNATVKDMNERMDRLEKIMDEEDKAKAKEREVAEQRKVMAKAKSANPLTNEFRLWLYREKRGGI